MSGDIIDSDAYQIGQLYQKSAAGMIEAVRARLECGRRLAAKKEELPHGQWLPWLEENAGVLGFEDRVTATRLMKAAKDAMANDALAYHLGEQDEGEDDGSAPDEEDAPELDEASAVALSRKMWGHKQDNHRAQGTGENEWYTPEKYIELARKVLGKIDLDPASSVAANKVVGADRYFTEEDDGLSQEWHGNVWLNPPYSQPVIAYFAEKMAAEVETGNVQKAIMLTHNYTDTAWFHRAESAAKAICFTRGRIAFEKASGEKAAPTQGQAFFYYGADVKRFREVFAEVGFIR